MKSFKQFLLEAKRERVEPQPTTLYHGSMEGMGVDVPPEWLAKHPGIDMPSTGRSEFYMTPHELVASSYALGMNPISPDHPTEADFPHILRFEADRTRFAGDPSNQASMRAIKARQAMNRELQLGSAFYRGTAEGQRERSVRGVQRQIERLLQSGKGTQGQREFEGIIRPRPKSSDKEWVLPQFGSMELTRTGHAPVEAEEGPFEYEPENIPQTSVAPREAERPNIGVSAFKGIQLTGPRLSRTFRDVPEPPSYFQMDMNPNNFDGPDMDNSGSPEEVTSGHNELEQIRQRKIRGHQ